jgi:hypothetical protein
MGSDVGAVTLDSPEGREALRAAWGQGINTRIVIRARR